MTIDGSLAARSASWKLFWDEVLSHPPTDDDEGAGDEDA